MAADVVLEKESDYDRLITACFHGDLKEVVNIVRSVRTVREITKDSCKAITAFMVACSNGNRSIVEFLLTLRIDVNCRDTAVFVGTTGLHQCVTRSQLECIRLLVSHGAVLDMKHRGLTPVQQASVEGKSEIVSYFISLPACTKAAKVEALELLGASRIVNVNMSVVYWLRSLNERQRAEPGDNVQAKGDRPHPAFGAVEFSTEQELANFSIDDVMTQAVLIRERIFGPVHRHSSDFIARQAFISAENGEFDKCISLLSYVLDVEQQHGGKILDWTWIEFCTLTNLFTQRMLDGSIVGYRHVLAVLAKLVDVIELGMRPHLKQPWNRTLYYGALYTVIRLISLLAQLQPSISADDASKFRQVLKKLVRLNVRDDDVGFTPLHWACAHNMTPYSPLDVVRLLLEAGADPRAVCHAHGDTPLHIVADNPHHTRPQIIQLLLTSGAHFDQCNTDGDRFTDLLDDDDVFEVVNPMKYLSLQCLSAKVVKRSGIPFESMVPGLVSEFIKMH